MPNRKYNGKSQKQVWGGEGRISEIQNFGNISVQQKQNEILGKNTVLKIHRTKHAS